MGSRFAAPAPLGPNPAAPRLFIEVEIGEVPARSSRAGRCDRLQRGRHGSFSSPRLGGIPRSGGRFRSRCRRGRALVPWADPRGSLAIATGIFARGSDDPEQERGLGREGQ
jgi:hypothetical protein